MQGIFLLELGCTYISLELIWLISINFGILFFFRKSQVILEQLTKFIEHTADPTPVVRFYFVTSLRTTNH